MRLKMICGGLALAAGLLGCSVPEPAKLCWPKDSEVVEEYLEQKAYNWTELEKVAEEVDHPEIDWLVSEINYVFFDKWPPPEIYKSEKLGYFPKSPSPGLGRHPWCENPNHPWNHIFIKEIFQLKNPRSDDTRIKYRPYDAGKWKEYDMEHNDDALETLNMLIRIYADHMAFRKIYIQK